MRSWFLLFLFILIFGFEGLAQTFINVDLTAAADITKTYSGARSGSYCNDNNCIVFNITLNANSDLLNFNADQLTGASFYTVRDANTTDCGPLIPIGTPACISGLTHVIISFCKPGGNSVNYTITASSTVKGSDPITLRQGCTGTISVTGLTASNTTWTSIYPGATGAYNSYLSCTSGCTSTNVTPGAGAPAYIDYRVSGTTSNCAASRSAMVRVYTVPPLIVNINPNSAVICNGNPVTLSATVTGGNPAYTYSWMKDGQSISQTTSSITVSAVGTYAVTVADNTANCSPVTQTATVTAATTPTAPTAPGTSICKNTTATLTATAPGGTYNWYDANGSFQATGATFTTPALTANTTYYVDATSAAGCTSSRITVLVTVNDIPAAPTAPGTSICKNTTATLTATAPGGTYNWYDANGSFQATGAIFTTPTLSSNTSYYVQTTVNNCTSPRTAVLVSVNPTPTITSLANASICNNTRQSYAITSDVSGATFSWSRATAPGISNAAVSGQTSSNITESLVNTTSAPIAVTYRIIPQANACIGQTFTYTVTVNSTLSITSLASAITCNNMAPNYTITSNVSGANFSWSRAAVSGISNTAVSGQTSNTITEALNNVTASNISVTYVIVPNSNGCTGNPFNYRVMVSPTPVITSAVNGVVCNNEAQSYSITSNISGTTFSWSRAEVAGISNTAVNDQNSSTITETLINTTSDPIAVAYTIIPEANGCTSTPFTYTVTVNPTPGVTSAANGVVCNSAAQRYSIQSNVSGATFTWSRAAITGISNTAVSGQISNSITEALINTTSDPIAVVYSIVPTANGCTGAPFTYTVTVNPTPAVTSDANGVVCNSAAQRYSIQSNVSGATFTWSRAATTGISNAAVSRQTSSSITETLINTTSDPIAVVYSIVPTANGCTGTPFTYTVTVNPTPAVTSDANGVVCNSAAQSYSIQSNVSGATFTWSRAATAGISNAAVSRQTSSSITEALINTTSDPIAVVYSIVPTANGCTGAPFTYTVTVNPTPVVTSDANGVICNSVAQRYSIQSNVSGATFTWSRAAITGISNTAVSGQISNSITEALINTTSDPIAVAYTIIPAANGCTGTPFTYTVTVNPTPVLSNNSLNQIVCSEGTSTPVTLTSIVSGTTFTWTVTATTGITGFTTSGNTNIIPAQTLFNTGLTAGTITYTIKPFYNGCEGTPGTYTITVNPKPTVTSATSDVICNQIAQNYSITSNISGATFNWSRVATAGISNAAVNNQTSNSITEILVNTTSAPIAVAYSIIAQADNCSSTPFTYTITVNPTPAVTSAASGVICSGTNQSYDIISNVNGTNFTWSRNVVPGISNPAVSNQTSNTITEALINTTSAPIAVAYTILPQMDGCIGQQFQYEVMVNPTPAITSATSVTICNKTPQNYIITSNLNGTTFSWSRATLSGIGNPAVSNQTSNTISETLVNTTSTPIEVTYTIIPEANGCIGSVFNYTVTVIPPTDPSFNYPSNTFCKTGTNPMPAIASSSGGTFSASPAGLVFADNHTGEINLSASATASYTITFTTNTTCVYSSNATITITPGPDATFSYNGPYCQKQPNPLPNFSPGSSAGVFSSTDAGLVFTNTSTGEIDLLQSLPGTYTVRNDIAAVNGCAATFATATVTINPLPIVNAGADQIICAGQTVPLSGSTGGGASSALWSGGTGTFSDASSLHTIYTPGPGETNATLYLTTNDPTGPCGSVVDEMKIIINPTPVITSATTATSCNQMAQNYTITGNVSGAAFSWSRQAVQGISNAGVSGQTSNTIAETLDNTTSAPIAVTYTIIPEANNCTGTAFTYTVTVNPTPTVTSASNATTCNQTSQDYTITSDVTGTTFSWSRQTTAGISNAAVSGQTSNKITETLVNTTSAPTAAIYTIIPEANGCPGTHFQYEVTVNPTPTVTSAASAAICNQTLQNYTITSDVIGATFSWSRATVAGISNAAVSNQTSNSINETLVNTTSAPIVVTYTIIPAANSCTGTPFQYQVTVNPTATITSAANATICNQTPQNYTITSDVIGAGFSWSRPAIAGISNTAVSNQTSSAITETLVNTTSAPIAVNYTIVPVINGCNGTPFQYEVTVKPTPTLSNTSFNQVICSEGSSVPVTLTANVSGATFTWTATATAGITGFTSNGNTNLIPAQTLFTSALSAGTVTYTVKPFYNGCEGVNSTYTITVNPKPATPLVSSNSSVCNGTSLMLTTPAVASAIYTWTGPNGFTSNLQNPEIANASAAAQGTYSLTITVNSCTGNAGTTTVTVNPTPPTPVAGSNGPICAGETLNLTASNIPGATYSWTGPNGFTSSVQNPVINNAQVTSSGTYTVKATVNGCISTAGTIAVVVNAIPPAPTVSSNSPVCATTNLNLTAASIAGANYNWTGPNGFTSTLQNPVISSATPANSGTYYVTTVSADGCTSPASSITVLVNPLPAEPVLTSNSPVCSGNSIVLTCTAYPGVVYQWTGPNSFTSNRQNPVIDNAETVNQGRYTVVITTPGCTVTNTAFIDIKVNQTPAVPVASSNSPVCAGQTLKLSATTVAGAIYNWSGPNGFISHLQNPEIADVNLEQGDKYFVTVTVNGCTSAIASTTVIVDKPSVVVAGNAQTVCANNPAVALSGSINGSTGIWSTTGSGTFTTGNTNLKGTYVPSAADVASGSVTLTLRATNTSPCAIASASFKLTIIPVPVVFAGNDQDVCINDQVTLNGKITNSNGSVWSSSGTGIFSPSNTSLNALYIPNEKDKAEGIVTLTLTATGNGNCTIVSDQMKIRIVPPPKVNAGQDIYVMQDEHMVLQPAVSGTDLKYNWTPNLYLNNPTLKNPTLTGTEDITYTLTVTGSAGCVAQDQVFVKVLKPITIPNTFTPNNDGINDTWAIKELYNYPDITVKIFNRYGMQLFYSQGYGTPWDGTYNGQPLPVGTYYYIIDLKTYSKLRSGPVTIIR